MSTKRNKWLFLFIILCFGLIGVVLWKKYGQDAEMPKVQQTITQDSDLTSQKELEIGGDILVSDDSMRQKSATITENRSMHDRVSSSSDKKGKTQVKELIVVTDTTVSVKKAIPIGRSLKYTDLPVNKSDVYAREHIYKIYKCFGHNDYIMGDELALYYKNRAVGNTVVNKMIAIFVKNNIVKITKRENGLVAETVKETGIDNHFKIPMVMNVSLSLQNNASLKVDPIINSKEPLFRNCVLLPLEMKGVTIIQQEDTLPRKGYVNGDFLFVDYPVSKMAYKLKN